MLADTLRAGIALAAVVTTGCAQSVYDFPIATMVGEQRGYSMTGYLKSGDEAEARPKIIERFRGVCPNGVRLVHLKAEQADAAIGTKIIRYETLAVCEVGTSR